jgi:hypothetical protein
VAEEVSTRTMHPDLRSLLIRRIRDQVERVSGFDFFQMAISIGECGAMHRSAKVRRPAIGERGS